MFGDSEFFTNKNEQKCFLSLVQRGDRVFLFSKEFSNKKGFDTEIERESGRN